MTEPAAPASPLRAASLESVFRQVTINATSLLAAYVLPRVLTVGSVVLAARVLGVEQFGQYGTAAALAVILSVVATFGMTPLLIREIARRPERGRDLVVAAHWVKTATNAIMLVLLYAIATWVLHYPPTVVAAAMVLGLAYVFGAYAENVGAYLQAIEQIPVWTRANALQGFVTGTVGIVLVLGTGSVVAFCAAAVAGQAVAFAWLQGRLAASQGNPRRSWSRVVTLARDLVPFGTAFLILTVYYKIDVLLLTAWRDAAEVGRYVAGYKFVDVSQALALVAVGAVYPRLSRATARRGRSSAYAVSRLAELALLGAIPAAGVLWLWRDPIVVTLFGAEYRDVPEVVAGLALLLPALGFNMLAGFVLGAVGAMSRVALVYGIGLVANVALNAWLVPVGGASGAAFAKLASETVIAAAFLVAIRLRVGAAIQPGVATAALGVGGCGVLAALLLPWVGPLFAAVLFLGATGLLYRRFAALHPEEREAVRLVVSSVADTTRVREPGAP